jgi:hypothetical protein
MLTSEIALWPSGPVVTLGAYFVAWKYLFSTLVLLWAASFLKWSSPRWLLFGTLGLAVLTLGALTLPLGRPYGVVEGSPGLFELAHPMVAAARGTASEGWLVGARNPFPLWSLALAGASGVDPQRLLAIYSWIPAIALTGFVVALYLWVRSIELEPGPRSEGPASLYGAPLAVFLVVFLSTDRLSFLEQGATLWPATFWLRPRVVCALALLFASLATLGRAERVPRFAASGALLAATAWTEPQLALLGIIAILVVAVVRRDGRPVIAAGVATLAFALWPVPLVSRWPGLPGTWSGALDALFAVTIDRGLVFALGVYGVVRLASASQRRSPALFLALTGSTFALYLASSSSATSSRFLDRELLRCGSLLLLAAAAGVGTARLLADVTDSNGAPVRYRSRPLHVWGIALLLVVSLPWSFPYWWHPVRMDETYRGSLLPISRQRTDLAEWIDSNTSTDAVFAAGPTYGPWIGALAGRRLLWIDGAADAFGDRREAQSKILESRDRAAIGAEVERWGVSYVAWGRLDADGPMEFRPERNRESSPFSEVYSQRRWVSVYGIRPRR